MKIKVIPIKDAAKSKNIFLAYFKKEPLKKEEIFSYLPEKTRELATAFIRNEFKGDIEEIKSLWFPTGPLKRLIIFGLGEKAKWNERKIPLLARRFLRHAKEEKLTEYAVPSFLVRASEESAKIFAVNSVMANFEFNSYKTKPQEGWPEIKNIYVAVENNKISSVKKGLAEGIIIGEETNHCRVLANTPGGDMTPDMLARAAQETGKRTGLSVKILEEKDIKKLGMGGILGVARGSQEKPKFIIIEYRNGSSSQKPLVLVGKGVTFDTGGLNLKEDEHIYEMHMDMSGGAAVIHGMAAIARLKLPINAVGLIPAVENMPSGSSYHPGDLLKTMSGKTIEVLNTDAEGRIILADALYYGAIKYKPGLMVDFATLTGAAEVALGKFMSALFTNQQGLTTSLVEIGNRSGDYVWPMPLWDEYLENIKGTFGDWANIGKRGAGGGAISGAKFLEQFIANTPWAHIDIAPCMTTIDSEFLAKGASGVGVRYIVELAKKYQNGL